MSLQTTYRKPCLSPSTHPLQCQCAYRQQEAHRQNAQSMLRSFAAGRPSEDK